MFLRAGFNVHLKAGMAMATLVLHISIRLSSHILCKQHDFFEEHLWPNVAALNDYTCTAFAEVSTSF
jgi:hypothetical protein